MIARAASILLVGAAVAVLAGCSAHEPPPGYTDAELEVYLGARLDAAWANTGLDGEVERPQLDGTVAERFDPDNFFGLSTCMSDVGLDSWQLTEQNGGPIVTDGAGARLEPELQLKVYSCIAEFPVADDFRNILLTPDQKRYLYRYYQSWVIPCLMAHRYELDVSYAPDEELFVSGVGTWNPYYSIVGGPGFSPQFGLDIEVVDDLEHQCGGLFADLDIELPGQFGIGG